MALPYSPPATPNRVEIDLDLTPNFRLANSATYNNKDLVIYGRRNTIDRVGCFAFYDCNSVTIIGGHFEPPSDSWAVNNDGNFAPATFTFTSCGTVYMEGVVIDNKNLIVDMSNSKENGGDAIYCAGIAKQTNFTMQNCHIMNVRGIETLPTSVAEGDRRKAHGDFFQAASSSMGSTGDLRFYNCTMSGNYQGMFLDPQASSVTGRADGTIRSVTLNRVNLKRTANVTPTTRLFFMFSSSTAYENRGYPVSLTDFYINPNAPGLSTQQIDDAIWPSNTEGQNQQFANTKYQADILTEGGRRYAVWPRLTNSGKQVTGRAWEGNSSDPDFCPVNQVGLNYVQGTELGAAVEPPPATGPAWDAVPGGNMLLQQNWTKSGPGTATVDGITGQIAITAAGTRTELSQVLPTEIGAQYRLSFHTNTAAQIASPVGSSPTTLSDYIADTLKSPAPGDYGFTFTATTATAYIAFTRTSAASPQASSIIFEKMPAGAPLARRLDGLSQSFTFDAQAAGQRTANHTWFIGGWMKWTHMPTSTAYIMDFGDATTSGGTARNRIAWDVAQSKLFCSSSAQDGTSYRECGFVTSLQRDVWYHIGMLCPPGGDIQLYLNGVAVGTKTGAQPTPFSETICKRLTFGARTGTTVTNFNPARYADWVWVSNAVPSAAQITALAAKQRPNAIAGFSPTYWWAFNQTSTTEPSLAAAATLTAVGAPTTVLGPMVGEIVAPVLRRPLDFILI